MRNSGPWARALALAGFLAGPSAPLGAGGVCGCPAQAGPDDVSAFEAEDTPGSRNVSFAGGAANSFDLINDTAQVWTLTPLSRKNSPMASLPDEAMAGTGFTLKARSTLALAFLANPELATFHAYFALADGQGRSAGIVHFSFRRTLALEEDLIQGELLDMRLKPRNNDARLRLDSDRLSLSFL